MPDALDRGGDEADRGEGAYAQATITAWLSTSVPSQSNTMSWVMIHRLVAPARSGYSSPGQVGTMPDGRPAERRMTLEFLVWDDGTDTRYEFLRGQPRGGARERTTRAAHEMPAGHRGPNLTEGPCRVVDQTSCSVRGDERFTCRTDCRPVTACLHRRAEADRRGGLAIDRLTDKDVKVPDYCALLSVDENWLIQPATADAGLAAAGRAGSAACPCGSARASRAGCSVARSGSTTSSPAPGWSCRTKCPARRRISRPPASPEAG